MKLNELYNIALDMLAEKKSNNFGFSIDDNATITVLSTDDGEIFKASNGSMIKNGSLQTTCSEHEAITIMMKSNKSKIDSIVSLKTENGAFTTPCEECIQLMLQINKDNSECNVMINDNESVKLHTLISNPSIATNVDTNQNKPQDTFNEWLDGWDDDTPTTDNVITNTSNDDTTNFKQNHFDSLPVFEDNPIPNQPTNSVNTDTSSYYQSKYLNSTPNPANTSSNSSTFRKQNNEITERMRQNGLSDGDKKDFNKQRLFNAFTVENIINLNGVQSSGTTSAIAEKHTLSKKELIKLAKEKKKMAKKDAKILEASNKHK